MTRPPEQRLMTEANAGALALDPSTPFGAAVAEILSRAAISAHPDPEDPDALLFDPIDGGSVFVDPSDADALIITT